MKGKFAIIGIAIVIFVALGLVWPVAEPETHIKQGVLTNVERSSDESFLLWDLGDVFFIMRFSDGEEITVREDTPEEAQEMCDYLEGWIGQEVIIGYYYDAGSLGNEISSVSPA